MSEIIWTPNHYKDKKVLFNFNKIKETVFELVNHTSIGGLIKLEKRLENGMIIPLSSWYHNNVTNVGLDMCYNTYTRYYACLVGSGTALPTNDDITLQSYIAGTTTRSSYAVTSSGTTTPYYTQREIRYTFPTGAVVGNIGEIAIASTATSGSRVFCRELVRDTSGNPATPYIASTEALLVRYRVRHYAPTSDVLGVLNISSQGTVAAVGYTIRSWGAGSTSYWLPTNTSGEASVFSTISTNGNNISCYTGNMTLPTSIGAPTGYLNAAPSYKTIVSGAYTNGTFSHLKTYTISTLGANGTIKTILWYPFYYSNEGACFQIQFDTAQTKTTNDTLTMVSNSTWGRYV